jgi:hypothetical protein
MGAGNARHADAVDSLSPARHGLANPQLVDELLQAGERPDPREKGEIVDRLGQEVVGTRLQPPDPVADVAQRAGKARTRRCPAS